MISFLRSMVFLKILSCSLIFILATASFELRKLNDVQHYNIYFVLYLNADIFHGECNISISIPYETQDICFYTENLSIIKIVIINTTQISEENETKIFVHRPNKFTYDTKKYITNISLPYYLSSGYYTLYVKFAGLLSEDGGFRTYRYELNESVSLVATHYHTFARRLFPLLKDTIYASYNISIKHHKNYTALSNMPVQEINMDENDMQWTRFKTTPIMPVYFLVANVIHLDSILHTNQNAKLWSRSSLIPHVKFAYSTALKIKLFLEDKFPHMKKSLEVNHVAIPLQLSNDVKLGFVLYREADIIFNQETDDEVRKFEITQVVAYKVIYEWLYNVIDPSKWDFWLCKGFATFFGNYVANKVYPHFRIHDLSLVQIQQAVLHWNTKNTWPLTTESGLNSSLEIPRFIKASIMFRSLQIIFTEEMFKFGMRWYLRNPYISSNFTSIMQSVPDISFQIMYNLEDRIINWTQLNHYPVINVKRNYNTNQVNVSKENSTNMWIFVNITTQSHSKWNKTLPTVWLVPHRPYQLQTIVFIDKNDWVLANIQSGCYRVNYDAENWSRLSKYLNTYFFDNIHVLDRAKMIDDTFHFLMTGRLDYAVFLGIFHYLWRDTDYVAWYPMFKNLEYISNFFAFRESEFIKDEIMHPSSEILSEIGYPYFNAHKFNNKDILTKCLRQELARWLCIIGEHHCLSTANENLRWYLFYRHKPFYRYESVQFKIWTGWKEWTFCKGLMAAENKTWMEVFDIYSKASDSSVLKYLACSKNSSIILQYINLMANMTNITAIDHINSFCFIVARHANNNLILDFILDDLEKVKPKEISFITTLTIIINHIYTQQQITKIKKYLEFHFKCNLEFVFNYVYHDENSDAVMEFLKLKKNMKNIMDVNRKLALRWNQINSQLYQYRNLIKDFDVLMFFENINRGPIKPGKNSEM